MEGLAREDWPRALALLDEWLDLEPAACEARLQALAGEESRLREPLRQLLASRQAIASERFMETLPRLQAEPPPRERVGPWRLLRELGRGGMGVVWLAERADGIEVPPVALKLPRVDAAGSESIVERFARERQVLAALDHPGIAGVRDAGVAEGQPWLAIEYVDGRPLTEDAAARALPLPERLRLFLQVLDAVAHAHAQLVIHRDLKPANVLIDRAGRVKLLDFGIAKGIDPDGAAHTSALTQFGARAMTPQYASPEQVAGGALGTSTDIYSLGVLLHELLTGRLPYRLARTTPGALEEAILGGAATLPSEAAPAQRRALRGDLDAIVAKAMALKPGDRYRSAEAFADDVRRHLDSRPIAARRASWADRAAKQLRRHALAYGAAAAVMLALAAGVAATLWQARLARDEAARANAVQRFVIDIFRANSARQSDPQRARETTARELLEIGSAKLEQSLAGNPEAHAEMAGALAQMHADLGLVERAAALRKQGVALAEQLHGPHSLQVAGALAAWAAQLHHLGRPGERRAALARALEIVRAAPDRPTAERCEVYRNLSEMEQSGNLDEAARWGRLAIADAEALGPAAELDRFNAYYVTALALHLASDHAAAEPVFQRAMAVAERCGCLFPAELIQTRVQLAETQSQLLKTAAAEASLRTARDDSLRLNGPRHLNTVQTTLRLASILTLHGRPREALALIEPMRELVDGPQGSDDFSGPQVMNTLANTFNQLGRYAEGAAAAERGIAIRDRARAGTPFAAHLRETLARSHLGAGRLDAAAAATEAAEAIWRAVGARPGQARWERLANTWVQLHLARGDTAAAQQRAVEMAPGISAGAPPTVAAIEAEMLRARLDAEAGRAADARRKLQQLRALLESRALIEQLPLVDARWLLLCGRLALGAGRVAQARAHFERAVTLRRAQLDGGPVVDEAEAWLARADGDARGAAASTAAAPPPAATAAPGC